jgi:hypothetical protein
MTLLANLVPRLGTLFAQRGVQVIAAGLLSGVVGGSALVATGLVPLGGTRLAPPTVALVACPGSGPALAQVPAGQTLLVTARSADGGWLQVYVGEPGVDRAWAPASALRLQTGADALPVADCTVPASAQPSVGTPTPTATAIVLTPPPGQSVAPTTAPSARPATTSAPTPTPKASPSPTPHVTPHPTPTPGPTPSPTPVPDTTAPSLTGLNANPNCIQSISSTISVNVTDPDDAISSVTIGISPPGALPYIDTMVKDKVGSGWHYTVTPQGGWVDGFVDYTVYAQDSHGNNSSASSTHDTSTTNYLYYAPGGCIV